MTRKIFGPLIAALCLGAWVSGCKPRHDESETKGVSAFNYTDPADPKQAMIFIFPETERDFKTSPPGAEGNHSEREIEKGTGPKTVSDVIAGLKAGTVPASIESLFPASDPCKQPSGAKLVVYLECAGPVEKEYCDGRYHRLSKEQYVCGLMKHLKIPKFLPNIATLNRMQAQIDSLSQQSGGNDEARAQIEPMLGIVKSITTVMQSIIDLETPGVIFMSQTDMRFTDMTAPFLGQENAGVAQELPWYDGVGPIYDFTIDPTQFRCEVRINIGDSPFTVNDPVREKAMAKVCSFCLESLGAKSPLYCRIKCSTKMGGPLEKTACR